jgi:hypothetical protein
MTKIMSVSGVLVPSNLAAVNDKTGDRMHTEIVRNGLAAVLDAPENVNNAVWKRGQIRANSRTDSFGGRPAAMDFITRLYTLVTAPGIKELGLHGELMVTVEGAKEPLVYRVVVKDNNVFFDYAELVWNNKLTPFMEK